MNNDFFITKRVWKNKKILTEMVGVWKQKNTCFPTVSEFSSLLNVLAGSEVFSLNEQTEITDKDISQFAYKIAVLSEEEEPPRLLHPNHPDAPYTPFFSSPEGHATTVVDIERYRTLAKEAGVRLTPDMEKTLEVITRVRGAEAGGQTVQDMINNLQKGITDVNRSENSPVGRPTTGQNKPSPAYKAEAGPYRLPTDPPPPKPKFPGFRPGAPALGLAGLGGILAAGAEAGASVAGVYFTPDPKTRMQGEKMYNTDVGLGFDVDDQGELMADPAGMEAVRRRGKEGRSFTTWYPPKTD